MKKSVALKLQDGDQVFVKKTGEVAHVKRAYKANGHVTVETDNGIFAPDEIR